MKIWIISYQRSEVPPLQFQDLPPKYTNSIGSVVTYFFISVFFFLTHCEFQLTVCVCVCL